jgi:large subunit ribosomal protein L18
MTLNTFNKKLWGTAIRPRVAIFRSNKAITAQFIDDEKGVTILGMSSLSIKSGKPVEKAFALGEELAKIAKTKKIVEVIYDRSNFKYHGQVKSLAEGLRKGGLVF